MATEQAMNTAKKILRDIKYLDEHPKQPVTDGEYLYVIAARIDEEYPQVSAEEVEKEEEQYLGK